MKASISTAAIVSLLSLTVAPAAFAQQPPPATEVGAPQLALLNIPAKAGAKLIVTTPAFKAGADIPFENTQYRGNVFPGLAWTAGPAGTKAYVVILQDADALSRGVPILHWTMVNIPATVTTLAAAMSAPPAGAQYGPNIRGPGQAYMGPRTPAGPKHRYHFQVFALDAAIPQDSTGTYAAFTGAMKDHVLASGEVVGLGQIAPATTPPPGAADAIIR
jgi:para-nitrobenzyl esterase